MAPFWQERFHFIMYIISMFAESFKFHYKLFFHFGFFSNVEWCLISTEVHTVL